MAEQAVIANRYAEAGREPIEHQQRSQGRQTPKLGQQGIGRQQMNCQAQRAPFGTVPACSPLRGLPRLGERLGGEMLANAALVIQIEFVLIIKS